MKTSMLKYWQMWAALLVGLLIAASMATVVCHAAINHLALTKSSVSLVSLKAASVGIDDPIPVIYELQVAPDAQGWEVSWNSGMPGDYDQDGTVGVSDLTPLAMHWQELVADAPELEAVDGSKDGVINIADVTAVAMFFGVTQIGYEISLSEAYGGPYTPVATVDYGDYELPLSGFPHYRTTISAPPASAYVMVRFLASDETYNWGTETVPLE